VGGLLIIFRIVGNSLKHWASFRVGSCLVFIILICLLN